MWWRLKRKEFDRRKASEKKRAMKRIVTSGRVPGILCYRGDEPVGWCSVAPRREFPVLDRSPVLKRVDDQPVWSIVCFFVAKSHRRQGIHTRLLKAAVSYARKHGARIVEGYPIAPQRKPIPEISAFVGTAPTFQRAGFEEVARRSPTRPIMRRVL
jgi:GNAT superfamily N-acetyltransferase